MQAPNSIIRRPQQPFDVLKRSAKACNRCRKRRTKCAGNPPHPCIACRDTGHACVYSESEKRVTVSESYLLELRAQARRGTNAREPRDADSDVVEMSSQDIELGFSGTDNWVLGNAGQYRMSLLDPCVVVELTELGKILWAIRRRRISPTG